MKKLLLFLLIFISVRSFGQHPVGVDSMPLQTLGNTANLVKAKGAIGSDSGFVNAHFPDTIAANRSKIKNYPGAQIAVGSDIYVRDITATKWNIAGSGSDTTLIITIVNDSTPNLQKVTDIGYTTTNPLVSYNSVAVIGADTIDNLNSVSSPTKGVISLNINTVKNPALSWTLPWLSGTTDLLADSADARTLQLPNNNGVLALSVNGILADVNGNIIDTAHRTDTAFIIQTIHDSLILRGPDTTILNFPLYAVNDSTFALKEDSLNRLDYNSTNYDTTTWVTHTLIDKQYLEDRIGGISGGGGASGLNAVMAIDSTTTHRYVGSAPIFTTDSLNVFNAELGGGLVIGDSITVQTDTTYWYGASETLGTGASPSSARFSTVASNIISTTEINRGISSTSMHQFSAGDSSFINRLYWRPSYTTKSRYFVLTYGLNDQVLGASLTTFLSDYSRAIDSIRLGNATRTGWPLSRIVVMSMPITNTTYGTTGNRDTTKRWNAGLKALCISKGIQFVDDFNYEVLHGDSTLVGGDGLHQNNAGYNQWAQAFIYYINQGNFKSFGAGTINLSLNVGKSVTAGSNVNVGGQLKLPKVGKTIADSSIISWGSWAPSGDKIVLYDGGTSANKYGLGLGTTSGGTVLFGGNNGVIIGAVRDDSTMTNANAGLYINNSNNSLFNGTISGTSTITAATAMTVTLGNVQATNGAVIARGSGGNFSLFDRTSNVNQAQFLISNGTDLQFGASNLRGFTSGFRYDIANFNTSLGTVAVPTSTFEVGQTTSALYGTVVVSGTSVTGTLTTFLNTAKVGDSIRLTTTSGVETKVITAVSSNTSITTAAFAGTASAVSYSFPYSALRFQVKGNGLVAVGSQTPTSTLHVNGSFATALLATATSLTATVNNSTIVVTATGQTITLPTAVGILGRQYTIKLSASGSSTVATTSSQTIDGSTTYSLSAQYKYVTVQSDNANWHIIANN